VRRVALQDAPSRSDIGRSRRGSPSNVITVHRVVAAIDCGQVVTRDGAIGQIGGGIAFGLTAALMGGVTLEAGRILESNFTDAPILRFNEMPEVEVHLVDSAEAPSGAGEAGVPPMAPAVANAVFAATGQRLRSLPLTVATG
jgi:isoquinoline 1-oxidoreductase beta subunit